jgi:hypothetical protein
LILSLTEVHPRLRRHLMRKKALSPRSLSIWHSATSRVAH